MNNKNNLSFLLIEDNTDEANLFKSTITRLNSTNEYYTFNLKIVDNIQDAFRELKNNYNGAIVDIKLKNDESGNDILKKIQDMYRMPVAVLTGTPDTDLSSDSPIKIYKKGESTHEEIINDLIMILKTGIFSVIGGKGLIEKNMNNIFWRNLYPKIDTWRNLNEKGVETELILLRYALSHMIELLDESMPHYSVEEIYITPTLNSQVKTGSILNKKDTGIQYVVLSPPCDLVIRSGEVKTDTVMLCEIDDHKQIHLDAIGNTSKSKRLKQLLPTIRNNQKEYYHWLPKNSFFEGGYVNFRKVTSYSPNDLKIFFDEPNIRIQDFIVKDILSRFSSYYARQGQPDFNFEQEGQSILELLFP